MTPKLTDDQRQAIEEHGGEPVYLVDTTTNATYVLMRAEQFEKVRMLLHAEFDPREVYPFVDRVMREGYRPDSCVIML
jgi:hypothetical protein